MSAYFDIDETTELLAEFGLPELPETADDDDTEARQLWLFRFDDGREPVGELVSYDDARAYCSRDDTHGEGWFVGFDRP